MLVDTFLWYLPFEVTEDVGEPSKSSKRLRLQTQEENEVKRHLRAPADQVLADLKGAGLTSHWKQQTQNSGNDLASEWIVYVVMFIISVNSLVPNKPMMKL